MSSANYSLTLISKEDRLSRLNTNSERENHPVLDNILKSKIDEFAENKLNKDFLLSIIKDKVSCIPNSKVCPMYTVTQ